MASGIKFCRINIAIVVGCWGGERREEERKKKRNFIINCCFDKISVKIRSIPFLWRIQFLLACCYTLLWHASMQTM